jgi:MSHA pilin protein MshD
MCARQRGFTLAEIVVLIVVLSVALVGVLLVFQTTARGSADPQVRKQALAAAEALLDEILLASYDPLPGTGARAAFDDVDDYAAYSTSGIEDIQGVPIPGLGSYGIASITVTATPLNGVAEAKRITVTVAGPQNFVVSLDGWRLKYAP